MGAESLRDQRDHCLLVDGVSLKLQASRLAAAAGDVYHLLWMSRPDPTQLCHLKALRRRSKGAQAQDLLAFHTRYDLHLTYY